MNYDTTRKPSRGGVVSRFPVNELKHQKKYFFDITSKM
jgi:hypothetical protein